MKKTYTTVDGNEAVAHVAYQLSEVVAIYPITPSSNMGEWADQWSAQGRLNLWGTVPSVMEMQSEGGAAGAIHGALQAGSLATTFTASQGLLLMIPNMYKIAGELTPTVFHIAARSLAAQGLSIFGDHSDVMSARSTGFAMFCSSSVQEAMDFALISQAATLKSRIPFMHFFDGFRTSHEVSKIELLPQEVIRAMIDDDLVKAHRERGLSPDHPVLRGTAQNPDVYFQARETVNKYYDNCITITQEMMNQFAGLTGRQYKLFDYHGAKDAERVIILMGSGADTVHETVDYLCGLGEKIGVLKVRLYRPFSIQAFLNEIPGTVKSLAVLDRTKEPGALGEPLYQDCLNALVEGISQGVGHFKQMPKIVGGRYGLSSKEFTPAMVKAVFDNLSKPQPKNHFTIGIHDDISMTSLDFDPKFSIEPDAVVRSIFYGLGSDGTVGANKNSIKIIGENTGNYAQGYFVYDSKKSGAMTVSHLRFGPKVIRSSYLITHANFLACHQWTFLDRYDMLRNVVDGGTFLINSPYSKEEIWAHLPEKVQKQIVSKKLKLYVIDAYLVARDSGMGNRINTVMQVCFFAISGVLPKDQAIEEIKKSIKKTYANKGDEVVRKNLVAVDHTLAHLQEVDYQNKPAGKLQMRPAVPEQAPEFVKNVLGEMISGYGDDLPVSALPVDGTYPTATAQWEKRSIAWEIPVWDTNVCIQCGKCAFVCPHGVIRVKAYDAKQLEGAPSTFKSSDAKDAKWKGLKYTIQVAPEDCTGCALCVDVCPARNKTETKLKAINMQAQPPIVEEEKKNWEFFLNIPDMDRRQVMSGMIRQQQVQRPLFEFSSACAGCGETPYIKLMSQLFGDRAIVANATGCSSIYGGNLPTTPWSKNTEGRGPAWANSLFEDNAEFGLGFRLSIDKHKQFAEELLGKMSSELGSDFVASIINAQQKNEADIYDQRERVKVLKEKLKQKQTSEAKSLLQIADYLVKKSVWIVGGDGWAYDIGFGGLDHVLASGKNVNILVLDTEVYSNTGGQMSKSTPRAAVAKFAASGKPNPKKDLGLIAMSYGNVYVGSVAMGAKDEHTLKTFLEAEAYDGPSIIIAYSHCIAHGINMATAMQNQKAVVSSGKWLLYRYNPERSGTGQNPLQLEPVGKKIPIDQYMNLETRFKVLARSNPNEAKILFEEAQKDTDIRLKFYEYMAARKDLPSADGGAPQAEPVKEEVKK